MRITLQDFGTQTAGLALGSLKGGNTPLYTPAGAPDTLSRESVATASNDDLVKAMAQAFKAVGKSVGDAKKESNHLLFTKFQGEAELWLHEQAKTVTKDFMGAGDEDLVYEKSQDLISKKRDDVFKGFENQFKNALENPYVKERWEAIKPRYQKAATEFLAANYQQELDTRIEQRRLDAEADLKTGLIGVQKIESRVEQDKAVANLRKKFQQELSPFNISDSKITLIFDQTAAKAEVYLVRIQALDKEDRKKLPKSYKALEKQYPLAAKHLPLELSEVFVRYGKATEEDLRRVSVTNIQKRLYSDPNFMLKHNTYGSFKQWVRRNPQGSNFRRYENLDEADYDKLTLEALKARDRINKASKTVPKGLKDRFAHEVKKLGTKIAKGETVSGDEIMELINGDSDFSKYQDALISETQTKQVQSLLDFQYNMQTGFLAKLENPVESLGKLQSDFSKYDIGRAYQEYPDADPPSLLVAHNAVSGRIQKARALFKEDPGQYAQSVLQEQGKLKDDMTLGDKAIEVNKMIKLLSGQDSPIYLSKSEKTQWQTAWEAIQTNPEIDQQNEMSNLVGRIYADYENEAGIPIADRLVHGHVDPKTQKYTPGIFPPEVVYAALGGDPLTWKAALYSVQQGDQLEQNYENQIDNDDLDAEELRKMVVRNALKGFRTKSVFGTVTHNLEEMIMQEGDEGIGTPLENWAHFAGDHWQGHHFPPGVMTGMRFMSGGAVKSMGDAMHRLVMAKAVQSEIRTEKKIQQAIHETHSQITSGIDIIPTLGTGHSVLIDQEDRDTSELNFQIGKYTNPLEAPYGFYQLILEKFAKGDIAISAENAPEVKWEYMSPREQDTWKEFMSQDFKMLQDETTLIPVKVGTGLYQIHLVSKGDIITSFPIPSADKKGEPLTFTQQEFDRQVLMTRDYKMAVRLGGILERSFTHKPFEEKTLAEWMNLKREGMGTGMSSEEKSTVKRLEERIAKNLRKQRSGKGLPIDAPLTYPELLEQFKKVSGQTEPQRALSLWSGVKNAFGAQILKRTKRETEMGQVKIVPDNNIPFEKQWEQIAVQLGFSDVEEMVAFNIRSAKDPEEKALFEELFWEPTEFLGKLKELSVSLYRKRDQ